MVYRRHIPFAVTLLALFSMGCTTPSGIDGFWDELDVSVTAENYNDAEDRFAGVIRAVVIGVVEGEAVGRLEGRAGAVRRTHARANPRAYA